MSDKEIVASMLRGYANGKWLSDVDLNCQPVKEWAPMWYLRLDRHDKNDYTGIKVVER